MTINQIPELRWYQYHTDEWGDPSGERHIPGGAFAFDKIASSGTCVSGIDMGSIELTVGGSATHYVSTPIAIVFHLDNIGRGSGVDGLKFYLAEDSSLYGDGSEPQPYVQMLVSGQWAPFLSMPSGAGTKLLLNNIPSLANVKRNDGLYYIEGTTDEWTSEYVYLNMVVPSHYPVGTYGVCGSGSLRFATAYSYYDIPS